MVTGIVLPVLSHNVGLMIRSRVHYSSQQVVTLGCLNPHCMLRYERREVASGIIILPLLLTVAVLNVTLHLICAS